MIEFLKLSSICLSQAIIFLSDIIINKPFHHHQASLCSSQAISHILIVHNVQGAKHQVVLCRSYKGHVPPMWIQRPTMRFPSGNALIPITYLIFVYALVIYYMASECP